MEEKAKFQEGHGLWYVPELKRAPGVYYYIHAAVYLPTAIGKVVDPWKKEVNDKEHPGLWSMYGPVLPCQPGPLLCRFVPIKVGF